MASPLARLFHNQAARCLRILIPTPLQCGGQPLQDTANRFSGFDTLRKTAEAVRSRLPTQITPLQWGVNESARSDRPRTCEISRLGLPDRSMCHRLCRCRSTGAHRTPCLGRRRDRAGHRSSLRPDQSERRQRLARAPTGVGARPLGRDRKRPPPIAATAPTAKKTAPCATPTPPPATPRCAPWRYVSWVNTSERRSGRRRTICRTCIATCGLGSRVGLVG
jgi:hypothetical protein